MHDPKFATRDLRFRMPMNRNGKGGGITIPVKASNGMTFASINDAAKYAGIHAARMSDCIRKDKEINGVLYSKQ